MHILATNIQLALMAAAMCFVAAGFHGRKRAYSIVSLASSAVMGMVAFMAAPGPNVVLGISERISIWGVPALGSGPRSRVVEAACGWGAAGVNAAIKNCRDFTYFPSRSS
ncbi:hypothetical protein [Arthrobacter sp. Bi83]|uniref:hypothetical protein n=1 Tax=Arthrobacter sp. Bi83 TaxID=2822353 RepID=UPI001E3B9DF1|nr:hypothetical protein [Arthrobacter sp. Bi83]